MLDDYLTQDQVADALGVSVGTLRHWRRSEQGPPWKLRGIRQVIYHQADLASWCETNNVAFHLPAESTATGS